MEFYYAITDSLSLHTDTMQTDNDIAMYKCMTAIFTIIDTPRPPNSKNTSSTAGTISLTERARHVIIDRYEQ